MPLDGCLRDDHAGFGRKRDAEFDLGLVRGQGPDAVDDGSQVGIDRPRASSSVSVAWTTPPSSRATRSRPGLSSDTSTRRGGPASLGKLTSCTIAVTFPGSGQWASSDPPHTLAAKSPFGQGQTGLRLCRQRVPLG